MIAQRLSFVRASTRVSSSSSREWVLKFWVSWEWLRKSFYFNLTTRINARNQATKRVVWRLSIGRSFHHPPLAATEQKVQRQRQHHRFQDFQRMGKRGRKGRRTRKGVVLDGQEAAMCVVFDRRRQRRRRRVITDGSRVTKCGRLLLGARRRKKKNSVGWSRDPCVTFKWAKTNIRPCSCVKTQVHPK